jgi:hypothetical protein
MVDLTRENSNCIFLDLQLLCERLEELDIESIMAADPEINDTYYSRKADKGNRR